jgi:hypothetical protein
MVGPPPAHLQVRQPQLRPAALLLLPRPPNDQRHTYVRTGSPANSTASRYGPSRMAPQWQPTAPALPGTAPSFTVKRLPIQEWNAVVAEALVPRELPRDDVTQAIIKRIGASTWSRSTMEGRRLVAERCAMETQLPVEELLQRPDTLLQAAVRVAEKRHADPEVAFKSSTARTFIRQAQAMHKWLNGSATTRTLAQVFNKSLVPLELMELEESALPTTPEIIRRWIKTCDNIEIETALFVMHKGAARWDESSRLKRKQLILDEEANRIFVLWFNCTKSSRLDPHDPRFLTVIEWTKKRGSGSTCPSAALMDRLKKLKPDDRVLGDLTSNKMEEFLKRQPVDKELVAWQMESGVIVKDHWTLHSPKKGTLVALGKLALKGVIPMSLIPLLAKHKAGDAMGQTLPSTTARYLPIKTDVALLHKTQDATILI